VDGAPVVAVIISSSVRRVRGDGGASTAREGCVCDVPLFPAVIVFKMFNATRRRVVEREFKKQWYHKMIQMTIVC
jgi:hypothetical protein